VEDYVQRVRAVAMDLIRNRYMLEEDLDAVLARARSHWHYATGVNAVSAAECAGERCLAHSRGRRTTDPGRTFRRADARDLPRRSSRRGATSSERFRSPSPFRGREWFFGDVQSLV
jgi:hypothetical protein